MRIISSSCSTTTTVLPRVCSLRNTPISLSVSRGCRPIEGSSSMYSDPTRLDPSEVARLMRWLSPPDRVLDGLSSVRYPRPTSSRKPSRLVISVSRREAILPSVSSNCNSVKNLRSPFTDMRDSSDMDFPPTFTYSVSGRSLVPWHAGHILRPRYRALSTRYCILYWLRSTQSKKPSMPHHAPRPCHRKSSCSEVRSA